MSDRHDEDCILCRAHALNMTEEQLDLVTEALSAGTAAGWFKRGWVKRSPTRRQAAQMLHDGGHIWQAMFGAPDIPESAEVAEHRTRHDHPREQE